MLHIIMLYGLPGVGKYTIGKELATLMQFEFYHNHIVVNEVMKRHSFGSPEFIQERDALWRAHFEQQIAHAEQIDQNIGLVFTFSPESTVPQTFVDWLHETVPKHSRFFTVALRASHDQIEKRLTQSTRQHLCKLTDLPLYLQLKENGTFESPVMPPPHMTILVDDVAPAEAAAQIINTFNDTFGCLF
jgi:broad-specificity NMP kinase